MGKPKIVSTIDSAEGNRRDFLYIATGAVGGVGAVLSVWPFVHQMNPDATVLALASIEVDLEKVAEGQLTTIKWRGNPVFVRHRTPKEIEEAKSTPLSDLKTRSHATPISPTTHPQPTRTASSAARNNT